MRTPLYTKRVTENHMEADFETTWEERESVKRFIHIVFTSYMPSILIRFCIGLAMYWVPFGVQPKEPNLRIPLVQTVVWENRIASVRR